MRIFVTGTGRCGTVSFWHACQFIDNYTAEHESPNALLHYPDNHIEINPQLRYVIKPLAQKHPDAFWIHLLRERKTCAESLARLNNGNWIKHYTDLCPTVVSAKPALKAQTIYDHMVDTIELSLAKYVPPENRATYKLERIKQHWPQFWNRIGAQGNYNRSLNSWNRPKNTSKERGYRK